MDAKGQSTMRRQRNDNLFKKHWRPKGERESRTGPGGPTAIELNEQMGENSISNFEAP